jgi:putative oxidoreductase
MVRVTRIFVPGNDTVAASFGLLLLRVWFGGAMLFLHGWNKLIHFSDKAQDFADPLHIGSPASLSLVVFAEVACAVLLMLGLVTRLAAAILVINMGVALALVHSMSLADGELAFAYLGGCGALLIAGPGRFSADAIFFAK